MTIDQLVMFLVVEPAHLGLSPRLGTGARIFLDLFQDRGRICVHVFIEVCVRICLWASALYCVIM